MTFVWIAGLANITRDIDSGALLDDMCGFVGSGIEVWRFGECYRVSECICAGTHCMRCFSSRPSYVGAYAAEIVTAK